MTAPLVPAHINLRGFRYMPLDVLRLRDSDFAAHAGGEGFRCAVLLWCASWHQKPAGSLPDDDKVLAGLVGMGRALREWRKVREETLRNWVKCDDGRLYHPVVAEKAIEAWTEHLKNRFRSEHARLKKAGERAKIKPYYPNFDEWRERYEATGDPAWPLFAVPGTDEASPGDFPSETRSKGREGKGRDISVLDTSTRAETLSRAEALARALRQRGFEDCSAGHPELIAAAEAGVSEAGIVDAAAGSVGKSVTYIARRAVGRLRDASASRNQAPAATSVVAINPDAAAERDWRLGLEAEIIDVQRQFDPLGAIDEAERDSRISDLRKQLAGGWPGRRSATA
jgi:hypothetical protein